MEEELKNYLGEDLIGYLYSVKVNTGDEITLTIYSLKDLRRIILQYEKNSLFNVFKDKPSVLKIKLTHTPKYIRRGEFLGINNFVITTNMRGFDNLGNELVWRKKNNL